LAAVRLPRPSALALAAALVAIVVPVAGCGSSGKKDAAEAPPPPARPQDFPKASGETLPGLLKKVKSQGPILSSAVSEFAPGKNRFAFGLFDRARAQIADASVAVYVAPVGGGPAQGPFLARYESLAVRPQFQSKNVANDPAAAHSVYVADITLPKAGRYEALGVARLDGRLIAAKPVGPPLTAQTKSPVPNVGDKAPFIHTMTKGDVGGAVSKIETRQPPSTMLDNDYADVVGKKPVILIFSTPALCQSRVCGPVLDIAEQIKAEHPNGAVFIHQEIYNDNQVNKGFRPQVATFGLPTEPWVFAIDRHGRVAARIEGAYSPAELQKAVDKATSVQ
jgi:hypothetical protein